MSCLFCDFVAKQKPVDVAYEDKNFLVIKDIKPSAPIHLLIIPKKHIGSVNDLKESHKDLIGEMFLLAKKIAKKENISNGYKLSFNVGEKGGQIIKHLHLHLRGGWE